MPTKQPTLSDLPMFASDQELAVAIVGTQRASYWLKVILPALLNKQGFPRKDELHDGWPVPLIRKWYDRYLGVDQGFMSRGASGQENWDVWKKKKRGPEAKAEKTVAGPITPEELDVANRRREKRLRQEAERNARLPETDPE